VRGGGAVCVRVHGIVLGLFIDIPLTGEFSVEWRN